MTNYKSILGDHTNGVGSGKRHEGKTGNYANKNSGILKILRVDSGVSRKRDYDIQLRSKPGRVVVMMETYPQTEVKP